MERWLLFSFLLICTACATQFEPSSDYQDTLKEPSRHRATQTTVFFLIDGLSFQALNPALTQGRLPNIRQHFLAKPESQVFQAHTLFPSLTFPAISSLLHEAPVFKTGSLGNKLLYKGRVVDFESMSDRPKFSEMMSENNIFTRLRQKDQRSVSLDYGLGVDATVSAELKDIKNGVAASLQDYTYLDQKKLASLNLLLTENRPEQWPEFIFVHLVGLDFISHAHGPQSKQAREYLETLDQSLQDVFKNLQAADKTNHKVISMMSADHGFQRTPSRKVDLEKELRKLDDSLVSFNEHRMASVYSKTLPTAQKLELWMQKLVTTPGIGLAASRSQDTVKVMTGTQVVSFDLVPGQCAHQSKAISVRKGPATCPEYLNLPEWESEYPFLLQNLAYFFQAPRHPDFIVTPAKNAVFGDLEGGYHGGASPDEVLVPLFMRNAVLANPKAAPPLWDLLGFL